MGQTPAYLLTFNTYGCWLRGDDRGSHDRRIGALRPNAPLRQSQRTAMSQPPFRLGVAARAIVVDAIREACAQRRWNLWTVHARVEHVHVVLLPDSPTSADRAMAALKSWSTRRLRETGSIDESRRVWARHGSTVPLWTVSQRIRAVRYVVHKQGTTMVCWCDDDTE